MIKRLTPITAVAWFLLVTAGFRLFITTVHFNSPALNGLMAKSLLPITLQYVILYTSFCMGIVTGIGILERKNWARYLYVIWSASSFIVMFVIASVDRSIIQDLVIFAVITFLLFRRQANLHFSPKEAANDAKGG